jgi:NPCBM/NEW2 domain/PEP-CTERM motif
MGYNSACCGGNIYISSVATNMFGGGNNGIGFHSNKGITFDLDAIEAANPGMQITRYTALVGVGQFAGGNADIAHLILLDGSVVASDMSILLGEDATSFDVPIPTGARFLTLVGTAGPDQNYFDDQGIIGNPTLYLEPQVPEPATAALAVLGLGALGVRVRRRRVVE